MAFDTLQQHRHHAQSLSDHVSPTGDVDHLNLSEDQLNIIDKVLHSNKVSNGDLQKRAASSGWAINRHLIYRYLVASAWSDKYNGVSIEDAVVDTINWRKSFGISKIDLETIRPLIQQGVAYVNGVDKYGRALLYFKFGKMVAKFNPDSLLRALMYTVERADTTSVRTHSGEFLALIDFEGVTLKQMPPFAVIKATINLLKLHYPYRLGGIYVTNTGFAFNMIWRLIKPLLPRLALSKTHIVHARDYKKVIHAHIGAEHVEKGYGGRRDSIADFDAYLREP